MRQRSTLVLVGGLPGTGKSALAGAVAGRLGFTVLNSDRIRKELAGCPPRPAPAPYQRGIYTAEWTERSNRELLRRAAVLLVHGESVIVDASFVSAAERIAAVTAAAGVSADLVQLRCTASRELAARRINARTRGASDADRAVAEAMRAAAEPWPDAIVIDTEHGGTAELPGQGLEVALAAIRPHGPEHLWRPTRLHMLPEQRSLPISPGHDKACEAISLRRHCPDQVLGVAIRLSPDDLSAFPADLAPGLRHPGHLRGMAPSLVSQVLEVCSARYVIAGAERPDHEVFGPSC